VLAIFRFDKKSTAAKTKIKNENKKIRKTKAFI
jgi:hypothetical protein